MLIFRLKPSIICSPEATLLISDVAYGLCACEYEGAMSLPIHAPSRESYIIDALDVTRVVSRLYPEARVEMRGMLMTRVCPIKVLHFAPNIPLPSREPVPMRSNVSSASLPDTSTVGKASRSGPMERTAKTSQAQSSASSASPESPEDKQYSGSGFLNRVKNIALNILEKGGFILEKSYQQIPSYSLDQQPRPGDREERFKPGTQWDTRNNQEAGDNATKDS